jgi:hypothetical protein
MILCIINLSILKTVTYDHRILRTRLPVRSALFKQDTGGLVVRWVTTSESPLLYVFELFALTYVALESIYLTSFATTRCLGSTARAPWHHVGASNGNAGI